ncbi:MAG: HNH endonuclease [Corynebacterium glucuronolyticum]|nr:HNH endonuclease [Corynebacterium glucuronolyticum]
MLPSQSQPLRLKQLRVALAIDQIFCSHDTCTKLAAFSQGHHVWPYIAGGETTTDNIVLACRPHNLLNDDDRCINGTPGTEQSGRAIIEAELGLTS